MYTNTQYTDTEMQTINEMCFSFREWVPSRSCSCWRSCAAVSRSRVVILSVNWCSLPSSVSKATRQMKAAWDCWASWSPWQSLWAEFLSWNVLLPGYRWAFPHRCTYVRLIPFIPSLNQFNLLIPFKTHLYRQAFMWIHSLCTAIRDCDASERSLCFFHSICC